MMRGRAYHERSGGGAVLQRDVVPSVDGTVIGGNRSWWLWNQYRVRLRCGVSDNGRGGAGRRRDGRLQQRRRRPRRRRRRANPERSARVNVYPLRESRVPSAQEAVIRLCGGIRKMRKIGVEVVSAERKARVPESQRRAARTPIARVGGRYALPPRLHVMQPAYARCSHTSADARIMTRSRVEQSQSS